MNRCFWKIQFHSSPFAVRWICKQLNYVCVLCDFFSIKPGTVVFIYSNLKVTLSRSPFSLSNTLSKAAASAVATIRKKIKHHGNGINGRNEQLENVIVYIYVCVCWLPKTKLIPSSYFAIYRNIYSDKTVLQDEIHTYALTPNELCGVDRIRMVFQHDKTKKRGGFYTPKIRSRQIQLRVCVSDTQTQATNIDISINCVYLLCQ